MGRIVRAAAAALVIVGLAGCWPAPGAGPDRRAHNPFEAAITTATVDELRVLWSGALPATGDGAARAPVVSRAGVHVTDGYSVSTFAAATGERLWSSPDGELPIVPVHEDPVVVGDRLLVTSGWVLGEPGAWNQSSAWLDPADGTTLGDPHVAPVTGVRGARAATYTAPGSGFGGAFFVHTLQVQGLDGTGGWSTTTTLGDQYARQPATLGAQRLYHAGSVMQEVALDAPRIRGVHAFPVAGPTTCHEPGPGQGAVGPILCTDWSTPTEAEPVTPPVLGPGERAVYVGLQDGTMLALDAADGSELWRNDLAAQPSAAPALADGWLYVPLAGGDLAVLDAATGALAWSAEVDGAGRQPAVAGGAAPGADGVVFVGTDAGELLALPAAGCGAPSCDPLWRADVGRVTGAPAVSGGRVYVGVGDPARLVAVGLAGPGG